MDAAAMAALAAIVDHDSARVLEHLIEENVALRQQLQDFQRLQTKMRQQAFEIFELRNTVIDQSLRIARLRTVTVHVISDDEE